jgi:hypothetical protein
MQRLGFTLAAAPELIREVSLPDQSERILEMFRKLDKRSSAKTLWKYVQACARKLGEIRLTLQSPRACRGPVF